jgi:hypothetical protein
VQLQWLSQYQIDRTGPLSRGITRQFRNAVCNSVDRK